MSARGPALCIGCRCAADLSSARAIWVSPSPNIRAPVDRRRLRAHDDAEAFGTPPPWELTTYFSKKKTRIVQKNGELLDDFSVMHELTREQRFAVALRVVSLESGVDEAVLAEMLQRLLTLVPGNEFLSRRGKEGWLVRFSLDVERVAELALAIKAALPHASVPDMLQARPEILDMSAAEFQAALESCRSNLGAQTVADVGSLVSELPDLLDPRVSEECAAALARLMPETDPVAFLSSSPSMLYSLVDLRKQSRGDRDAPLL